MMMLKKIVGCVASEPKPIPIPIPISDEVVKVKKSHFITAGLLGEGGFGKVLTGTCIKNSEWYAIKQVDKVRNTYCILVFVF